MPCINVFVRLHSAAHCIHFCVIMLIFAFRELFFSVIMPIFALREVRCALYFARIFLLFRVHLHIMCVQCNASGFAYYSCKNGKRTGAKPAAIPEVVTGVQVEKKCVLTGWLPQTVLMSLNLQVLIRCQSNECALRTDGQTVPCAIVI